MQDLYHQPNLMQGASSKKAPCSRLLGKGVACRTLIRSLQPPHSSGNVLPHKFVAILPISKVWRLGELRIRPGFPQQKKDQMFLSGLNLNVHDTKWSGILGSGFRAQDPHLVLSHFSTLGPSNPFNDIVVRFEKELLCEPDKQSGCLRVEGLSWVGSV